MPAKVLAGTYFILLTGLSLNLAGQDSVRVTQDTLRNNDRRVGIMAGIGVTFGGVGASLEYQMHLKQKLFLTPFAGFGLQFGNKEVQGTWLGNSIGCNVEWGEYQRLLIGVCYGTNGIISPLRSNSDTVNVSKQLRYGPSAYCGYKGIAPFGLMWQIYFGATHALSNRTPNRYKFFPVLGAGLGYRFNKLNGNHK